MGLVLDSIKGLDGYALLDYGLEVTETNLDASFLSKDFGKNLDKVFNETSFLFSKHDGTIFLCEKSAIYLSELTNPKYKYILIFAGHKEPVDIPVLIEVGKKLRAQLKSTL